MKPLVAVVLFLLTLGVSAPVQSQYSGYCPTCVVPVPNTFFGNGTVIIGNGTYRNIFSVSLPAGTFTVGGGIRCWAAWLHGGGTANVMYQWTLGSTTFTTATQTGPGLASSADITIFTPSSLMSQIINIGALINSTSIAAANFQTASEDLSTLQTLKIAFNVASPDSVTPKTFYCLKIE